MADILSRTLSVFSSTYFDFRVMLKVLKFSVQHGWSKGTFQTFMGIITKSREVKVTQDGRNNDSEAVQFNKLN